MMRVIVNPTAGHGRAKKIGERVAECLEKQGVAFSLVETTGPGCATILAKEAAAEGVDTVLAVGGDGTVSETAAGLIHTKTALGIISAGTGNDLVKALHIPTEWQEAMEFLFAHPPRAMDAGVINDTFFVNVCGAGFDVMVLDYSMEAKKFSRGIWPYLYGVVRSIQNFKPFAMHIEIDEDTVIDGAFLICSVANGKFVGGGIPIAPTADVTDGRFDVVVVDAVPRWKIPFYLPGLLGGRLLKYKVTRHYRARKCVLESRGMRLNLDGEILPMERADFTCLQGALQVHW